ncbi:MAG: chromosome segregation protein SMC [Planctomycetota bacterium]
MISLKALELFGFKSFADRTRFEFPAGVTAVVGPNGSGKSNVVDAIKWVLGEQSARSLRGKEMTDVIFAGSTGRKPLNMAEVALVFDNRSRELPLAADEVQIMRRVYRSGESEYLVNGETARLKDIREVFSGTGAATEAYSVIEQGRVDALLTASGRDRRAVFEEAAGITRFRARRAEALRRLERAELNRQRLADIVGEVSARLETVRNQAAKARRWRTLTDRLKTLRIAAATRDLAGVDATVAAVEEALAADRAALTEAEALVATTTDELARLGDAATAMQTVLVGLRTAAAEAGQRAAAAAATLQWQRSRRVDLEAEGERLAAALDRTLREAAAVADEAAAKAKLVTEQAAVVAAIEERLADCERQVVGSGDDADTARRSLADAAAACDAARERTLRAEAAAEVAEARAATLAGEVEAARDAALVASGRRARLGEARAAGEGHVQSLQARLAQSGREVEAADSAHRDANLRLQQAWRELADRRAAAEACRERRDVLRDLVSRQEGLSDSARRLLLDEPATVPGLAGLLADCLVVPVAWAALVDLTLGRASQSLLVASLDEAIDWHAGWSTAAEGRETLAAGGRVGLLAAAALPEPPDFEPRGGGVVGRLDRLVLEAADGPASDPVLVRRLLGRAWVVESVRDAAPLLAEAPLGTLFLSRSGDCLSATGGLEVGPPADAATGLVTRRSELRDLEERARSLAAAVDAATADVTTHEADVVRLGADLTAARGRQQQAADAIAMARAELDRIGRDERAADEAIAASEVAVHDAERRAITADAAARAARAAVVEADATLAAAEAETGRRRAAVESLERSRSEISDELHRLRIELVAGGEKLARHRDEAAGLARRAAARRDEIAAADAAIAEAALRIRSWELELLAASSAHAEAAWLAETAALALARAEAEARHAEAARQAVTDERDAARDRAVMVSERIHARELEAGEARHGRARIVERIRDEYDLDIEAFSAQPATNAPPAADDAPPEEPVPEDRAELEAAIEQLRRKVAGIGNVNLEALAEAEELTARLATLQAQLDDVTAARESIEQLIARIDEDSRRLLGETIETVRGHFRELFERVFGGGQADIVLEPGVDVLETSVEIVARPPGKEPRNISLLSGGEKTMTCVALLLAIFRSRPSPFCVLDEVDAALDEANIDRFVGVLRDFLSATQFIVVTHSKKTMAAAGTLYGVTMEESGVSKRVSVRFEAAAAARTSRAA